MTETIDENQLASMLNGVDIPPCPSVLLEIDAELKKEAPNQRDIAMLISKDVSLSGHIMQIACSPVLCGGNKPASIIQALNLLGSQQIFNLVVHQLLKTALADNSGLQMARFWETSATTARVAAELSRRLRCVRPDIAYTIGLFRDCGIPLMARRFPDTKEVLIKANAAEDASFTAIEDQYLGTNHASIGYFLARRWRLPADVCETIRYHHDYNAIGEPDRFSEVVRGLIAVGVLAEHITRQQMNDQNLLEWPKAVEPACAYFNLSLGAIDDLIEDMLDWLA